MAAEAEVDGLLELHHGEVLKPNSFQLATRHLVSYVSYFIVLRTILDIPKLSIRNLYEMSHNSVPYDALLNHYFYQTQLAQFAAK